MFEVLVKQSDCLSLTKFLHFWYNNCSLFSNEVNLNFFTVIIKLYFFDMFFHWAAVVRQAVQFLILYRLVFRFETDEENPIWNDLVVCINNNLNNIAEYFQEFHRQKFRWNSLSKFEKRKSNIDVIAKKTLVNFRPSKDYSRFSFFPDSKKLKSISGLNLNKKRSDFEDRFGSKKVHQNYFESGPIHLTKEHVLLTQSTDEDNGKSSFAYPDTFVALKIFSNHFFYFDVSIEEFKFAVTTFYSKLNSFGKDKFNSEVPMLRIRIPMDKTDAVD